MDMNKRRGGRRTVEIGAQEEERRSRDPRVLETRKVRIASLQDALAACPVDIRTRYELAILLEDVGRPDEALVNWRAILNAQPNSLAAREGVARCREQIGRILDSLTEQAQITGTRRC